MASLRDQLIVIAVLTDGQRIAMKIGKSTLWGRWFWTTDQAWSPTRYEWWFDRTRIGRRLRTIEQGAVVNALESGLRSGQTVLEVGSGTGHYTMLLDDRGAKVIARDGSNAMVGYLRDRLVREGRSAGPQVEIGQLPHDLRADGPFDGVLTVGVLNYVEDLTTSLRAFASRLAPDGWVVFTVPPDNRAGRCYRLLEQLGRRRVYVRSAKEVAAAARDAGLVLAEAPTIAGVMAVYHCIVNEREV